MNTGRRTRYNNPRGPADSMWKALKNEIIMLVIVLIFILSLKFILILIWGWFGPPMQYPALQNINEGLFERNHIEDSDNDGLPNAIEDAPVGVPVYNENDHIIGYGTGTNSHKADTDGDFFPDGVENVLGTDPNNWFFPGYIWIIWGTLLLVILYLIFFYKPDRLKEYIKNEMNISGQTGKYAYTKPSNTTVATPAIEPALMQVFREVVASDHFAVDNITARAQATRKQNQMKNVGSTTSIIGIIFIVWGILLIFGNKVKHRYDIVRLDNFLFAVALFMIGLPLLIIGILNLFKARKAVRRSKQRY